VEAINSSETPALTRATRRYIPRIWHSSKSPKWKPQMSICFSYRTNAVIAATISFLLQIRLVALDLRWPDCHMHHTPLAHWWGAVAKRYFEEQFEITRGSA
jgi:hypothetical protein